MTFLLTVLFITLVISVIGVIKLGNRPFQFEKADLDSQKATPKIDLEIPDETITDVFSSLQHSEEDLMELCK